MVLTPSDIARLIDLSAVRTDVSEQEIRELAGAARRYGVIAAFPMPCYTALVRELLEGSGVLTGGVVGFPSGSHMTTIKVAEARQQLAAGAQELDMVCNVGWLLSGRHDDVRDDIRAVVQAAAPTPVKVILETHFLNDDQIRAGAELCVQAGAAWVKTGTGWAPTGATLHNVALIKSVVGDRAGVKAAGGVRDLATLVEMHKLGVRRFGISAASGKKILEEATARSRQG